MNDTIKQMSQYVVASTAVVVCIYVLVILDHMHMALILSKLPVALHCTFKKETCIICEVIC